jgi:hypothetical protein
MAANIIQRLSLWRGEPTLSLNVPGAIISAPNGYLMSSINSIGCRVAPHIERDAKIGQCFAHFHGVRDIAFGGFLL